MKEQLRDQERATAARSNGGTGSYPYQAGHHQSDESSQFESGEYFKQLDMTKKSVEEKHRKQSKQHQ